MRKWQMFKAKQNDLFDTDTVTIRVCRSPDETHPYLETANFEMPVEFCKTLEATEVRHEDIFALAREGQIKCTGAVTWCDYFLDGSNIGGTNHFIHEESIPYVGWFQSGVGHGMPTDWFDERLILGQEFLEWRSFRRLYRKAKAGEIAADDVKAIDREYKRIKRMRFRARVTVMALLDPVMVG
jgi:hypothetical protein